MSQAQLGWIGLGIIIFGLLFLAVAFFAIPDFSRSRANVVRFFAAIVAGFAGGFLTGSALFDASWTSPGGKVAISGTAGFALFLVVMVFYNKFAPDGDELLAGESVHFDLPEGWNFQQVIRGLAQYRNSGADFVGFKKPELDAAMLAQAIETKSMVDAMLAARSITVKISAVRAYDVQKVGGMYVLKVRSL